MNTDRQLDKNSGSRLLQTVFFGPVLKKNKTINWGVSGLFEELGATLRLELNYKIAEQLRFTDVFQQPDNTAFQSARAPGLMNY